MRRPFRELLLVALLGTVAAAAAPARTKVVVLDIAVLDTSAPGPEAEGVKRLAEIAGQQVSIELAATGQFEALSGDDLGLVIGLERQRQLLGCDETASNCLAELSGALGAPLLITGSLARAGGKLRLDLKLVRTSDASVLARQDTFLAGEAEVFTAVPVMVKAIADLAAGRKPAAPGTPRSIPALVVSGVGLAAAAGGVALWVHQSDGAQRLTRDLGGGELLLTEAEQRRSGIYTERAIGVSLLSGGAAVAVGGLVWFLLSGGPPSSTAALVPIQGGALISWGASF